MSLIVDYFNCYHMYYTVIVICLRPTYVVNLYAWIIIGRLRKGYYYFGFVILILIYIFIYLLFYTIRFNFYSTLISIL